MVKLLFIRKIFDIPRRFPRRDRARKGGLPFNRDKELSTPWIERSAVAAKLLSEHIVGHNSEVLRIADIGCGDCKLRLALAEAGVRCEYDGYDLHPASAQVTRFDVRTDEMRRTYDLIAMLGVIEYLEEPVVVLRRLSKNTRYILFSHVVTDEYRYSSEQMKKLDWYTHLSSIEIEEAIANSGMSMVASANIDHGKTRLWLCSNNIKD